MSDKCFVKGCEVESKRYLKFLMLSMAICDYHAVEAMRLQDAAENKVNRIARTLRTNIFELKP